MGCDDHYSDVHGDASLLYLDLPVIPGGAEAGTGLPECDTPGASGFSDAADRSSDCFRSAATENGDVEPMEAGGYAGRCVSGELRRGAMAVCRFSDVARFSK